MYFNKINKKTKSHSMSLFVLDGRINILIKLFLKRHLRTAYDIVKFYHFSLFPACIS